VLGGIVLFSAITYGRELALNLRQPLRTTTAQIMGRRIQEEQGTGWSPATVYFVTFADAEGQTLEYVVPEDEYARLQEGQQGILRTKGAWYCSFKKG
jgi:hypothetical protein